MNVKNVDDRKYFGQKGDDFLIWSLFPPEFNGFYVDVGAFDGIHLSNSYSFEDAGWKGVCVEANPEYYPILVKNRPASICIHAACVGDAHKKEVVFLSEPLGLLSGIEAFKTQNMERRYASRGMKFPGWSEVVVPSKTLTQILDDAGAPREISFLSVDVEGTEQDVFMGLDLLKYNFRLIVTEANDDSDAKSVDELLKQYGYFAVRKLGANTFYVRSTQDADLINSATGTVKIEDTLHPLGEQATRQETRGRIVEL